MPGIDGNRFVGLSNGMADGLTCNICLNIFDNPAMTDCGHTFCKTCIEDLIRRTGRGEGGRTEDKGCPVCRKRFPSKRSYKTSANDNTFAIRADGHVYVFTRNLAVSAIIGRLTVKCDYEFNGCLQTGELDQMNGHRSQCEHRFCKTCDFEIDHQKAEDHNCALLLKNQKRKLEMELINSNKEISELKKQNERLEHSCDHYERRIIQLQDFQEEFHTTSIDMLLFGTLILKCEELVMNGSGTLLRNLRLNEETTDAIISFGKLKEIMYFSGQMWELIVFRPRLDLYNELKVTIRATRAQWEEFGDTTPNDEAKRYIIIRLNKKCPQLSSAIIRSIGSSLIGCHSNEFKVRIINEAKARSMVTQAHPPHPGTCDLAGFGAQATAVSVQITPQEYCTPFSQTEDKRTIPYTLRVMTRDP